MKLSKNFSLVEFTKSNTATRLGIDNTPTAEHLDNLQKLVDNVLQPLRDFFGTPIRITSGYRSEALNKAIGGSKTSDHCKGMAADIEYYENGVEENAMIWHAIHGLDLNYRQAIYEFGNAVNPDWVHISYNENDNKKQDLQAYKENGKTKYRTL